LALSLLVPNASDDATAQEWRDTAELMGNFPKRFLHNEMEKLQKAVTSLLAITLAFFI
jgi:hypothetical protein